MAHLAAVPGRPPAASRSRSAATSPVAAKSATSRSCMTFCRRKEGFPDEKPISRHGPLPGEVLARGTPALDNLHWRLFANAASTSSPCQGRESMLLRRSRAVSAAFRPDVYVIERPQPAHPPAEAEAAVAVEEEPVVVVPAERTAHRRLHRDRRRGIGLPSRYRHRVSEPHEQVGRQGARTIPSQARRDDPCGREPGGNRLQRARARENWPCRSDCCSCLLPHDISDLRVAKSPARRYSLYPRRSGARAADSRSPAQKDADLRLDLHRCWTVVTPTAATTTWTMRGAGPSCSERQRPPWPMNCCGGRGSDESPPRKASGSTSVIGHAPSRNDRGVINSADSRQLAAC